MPRDARPVLCSDPLLRHGWQHDDGRILDAVIPRLLPQKVPGTL